MTGRWVRVGAWAVPALTLVATALIVALGNTRLMGMPPPSSTYDLVWDLPYVAFGAVGALILVRRPTNRIGWILTGIGFLMQFNVVAGQTIRYLNESQEWQGIAGWLQVLTTPLSVFVWGLIALLLVVFPDGRLPSQRWRWLVGLLFVGVGLNTIDLAVSPTAPSQPGMPLSPLINPALAQLLDPLTSFHLVGVWLLLAAVPLFFRWRSGSTVVRRQIKWFGFGVVMLVACSGSGGLVAAFLHLNQVQLLVQAAGLIAVPAAIGIAVLRQRLFDIDLIISRTLAYGALAAVATGLYVGLVVGIGTLLGRAAGANVVLSIVATAIVAVAFQPLRLRLQAAANRLVYGRRQAPYESLAGFTRQLADRYSLEAILPMMAAAVARGLTCQAAAVIVGEGERGLVMASWPDANHLPGGAPDHSVAVSHRGEKHGSLAVWTNAGEDLNGAEKRLLADLALQAGLVLHNARLTADLERRLEELQASRWRLVGAQDAERRRLERDLHDGAQHDLVALRMKLGQAEGLAAGSGSPLSTLLSELREDSAAALENIRRLSRGLYPPLLESQGLAPALTAHSRRLRIPVDVRAGDERFAREVETAIYFCCVEALQNVAKHSGASQAGILIEPNDGRLHFEVGDDGHGFDSSKLCWGSGLQNITDRIEALGGSVEVLSGPQGTRIAGDLPLGNPGPQPLSARVGRTVSAVRNSS